MSQLIDELLTLAHLEEGKLTLRQEPVDLASLFMDIQRQVTRIAEERLIRLHIHIDPLTLMFVLPQMPPHP